MWNLTIEATQRFSNAHLLTFPESDEEWESRFEDAKKIGENLQRYLQQELSEKKAELLLFLPERFKTYVKDGTINQPTLPREVREDYLAWVKEEGLVFEAVLEEAYKQSKSTLALCSETVNDAFSQSLHDSEIWKIERNGCDVEILLKCDSFTSKDIIVLTFRHVTSEISEESLCVGQHYIYDELQRTENGFALRVLWNNDFEWTIEAESIDARSYYYPVAHGHLYNEGILATTTIEEYIHKLNREDVYTFITPNIETPITGFTGKFPFIDLDGAKISMTQDGIVLVSGGEQVNLGKDENILISYIYTKVYEDPFEIQRTPLPQEILEEAVFSNDAILQVRAWYTMCENPQRLAIIINEILLKMDSSEENQMMIYVYVNRFYKANILSREVIDKYRNCIEA